MQPKFLLLIIASLSVLLVTQVAESSFADVVSPSKQVKIGLDKADIICKTHLVKVYRINADSIDCFTPTTAEKLIKAGIANEIPKEKLEAKKSFRQSAPIGTITGLDTVKKFGSEGKFTTTPRTVEYLYVFEACANEKTIRAPEVLITSDSEAKTVKLAKKIQSNTCFTSSAGIKAVDPNSISGKLTNKGLISDKLTELEGNISQLQEKLSVLKKSFSGVIPKDSTPLTDTSKVTLSGTADEIVKLRAELNLAKAELNKYLYTLHSPQLPASQFAKQKLTFTGTPIDGASAKILTVSKQTLGNTDTPDTVTGVKLYNVVFEACSGNDVLRAPEVRISSDNEEKTIKIAERIIANSCQMSAGKINALDSSSITTEIANRGDISANIIKLESDIGLLLDEQVMHQKELNKLVVLSVKPADYEQKVSELSNRIIELRNEMRDMKFQLYGNLYEVYK
ncbi:MAG: hypothetical protein HKP26_04825 [Nitrosopumilus sp.]|nr:hypothetical protein [Nitrosopumilus sp.]